MPVEVSLQALVSIENTRDVWPEEFRGLMDKLEENPDEKTQWVVLAEWCQERGELPLSKAFDWVSRRPEVTAEMKNDYGRNRWTLKQVPHALRHEINYGVIDTSTLAGAVAELAKAILSLTAKLL